MPALCDLSRQEFHLRYSHTTGVAEKIVNPYAPVSSGSYVPIVGDWNGDGVDSIGLYDPVYSRFFLKNTLSGGPAEVVFDFGAPMAGWIPVSGDWNGDGIATIGLYDPMTSLFYLRNTNTTGMADMVVGFGAPWAAWRPIVGDWDGVGGDTVGLYDPATSVFYLRNSNTTGIADIAFAFGPPYSSWIPLSGDWDANGTDTVGLYDPYTCQFYLRNSLSFGYADFVFGYGDPSAGWRPLTGDWNGNGSDTVGLYDPLTSTFYLRNSNSSGYADLSIPFGVWPPAVPLDGPVLPVAEDWNGDGQDTWGLYARESSRWQLFQTDPGYSPAIEFDFGPCQDEWFAVAGIWAQGRPSSVGLYDLYNSVFYLRGTDGTWDSAQTFAFGKPNSLPIAGDWNGDGVDTIGLYDPDNSLFYLKNSNEAGAADLVFRFGPGYQPGAQPPRPVAGDWDGDGTDTIGLYDPNSSIWYLRNTNSTGPADKEFTFGPLNSNWLPVVGDWDGQ